MSSPFPWPPKPSPRDGPHGGAPAAQPHAPDSLPPQTVVGSSCTPLSKKGATTEATEVIEQPPKPIEPVELSEADTRKIQEAFVLLREETVQGHVDHDVPVLLNIISTLLHGPILAQVTFPTGDPEEALAKALLLQRLVANSSGGADLVVKLQQSKLLMNTSSSPTPPTPSWLRTPLPPIDDRDLSENSHSRELQVISDTRSQLLLQVPRWYYDVAASVMVISVTPWSSAVHSSPTSYKDLNSAMPLNAMVKLFSAAVKDGKETGDYTKTRPTLLMGLAQHFCAAVYSSAIAGSAFAAATLVGHRRALDIALSAVQNIAFLEGAATLARRASVTRDVEGVLTEFITALDDNLTPNESDQYLKWHSLTPAPGETARQFLTRLITAAATISKTQEDIVKGSHRLPPRVASLS